MNIQIFGTSKCFDTKKAQRYFQERRIKVQFVDLQKFGMSKGELRSIKTALKCKTEDLVSDKAKQGDAAVIAYLASEEAKEEKLLENQSWFKTPIVRCGKQAALGVQPEIWKQWEAQG